MAIEDWKEELEGLRPILADFLAEARAAKEVYERALSKATRVKARYDFLDRKIAQVEKTKVLKTGESGRKKERRKASGPVDMKALFASMTDEEKAEFIKTITNN